MKQTATEELYKAFNDIVSVSNRDLIQENANLDGRSPCGIMSNFASEGSKFYTKEHLLSEETIKAMNANIVYPHDLDYYTTGTTTCCQIPLGKLLKDGFNTGHGHMRTPSDISSALSLASIIFQANQNMQHGGQSMPTFDVDLAPYVKKTFHKVLTRLKSYPTNWTEEQLEEQAWKETEYVTYQACEAFIHNQNSMHSRGGGQTPFTSINYGTDTSKEGRMLVKNLLLATQAGLGNGETPIFPIQIFKMKKGVNFYEEDPNYDLYQLALETTAKRLFPNFSFVDSTFNLQYYEEGNHDSEIAYMGCRTRVMSNRHGKENAVGRGNLSFTSLNLVKLALISKNVEHFFKNLEHYIGIATRQLHDRYLFQARKQAQDFSFLYSQGLWEGGEELNPEDTLEEILKQGTLSLGFIGLAECLTALTGKHHGESNESWELGKSIVSFMREKMDQAAEEYDLNFSLIATPAEGLSGKFVKKDLAGFGCIEGVTDRAYYTNSFHVPVHYTIRAVEKIRIEGAFHELCNAGHITYIEVDGDVRNNIKAMDTLVKAMAHYNIGYGSINHPLDQCKKCGYNGVIYNECPSCHTTNAKDIKRIRRITGYLVGDMSKWNSAKVNEEASRVRHGVHS
ncbi:anaerobic ribonucleoside triphosphate reductase [Bacillus cereus]|uniref:anaerobic ribonucleoside triphosphate reductase n=1 Tax=Bacillus cereus TaxID=1396 RepID=UPI000BF9B4D7|nr:anaerobic ribonucleoside triphosphate reductase [Bacillus cereus]PFB64428.1 anaerobic ribonucleoside-triphosphate reductase [Bacillus cereus]